MHFICLSQVNFIKSSACLTGEIFPNSGIYFCELHHDFLKDRCFNEWPDWCAQHVGTYANYPYPNQIFDSTLGYDTETVCDLNPYTVKWACIASRRRNLKEGKKNSLEEIFEIRRKKLLELGVFESGDKKSNHLQMLYSSKTLEEKVLETQKTVKAAVDVVSEVAVETQKTVKAVVDAVSEVAVETIHAAEIKLDGAK